MIRGVAGLFAGPGEECQRTWPAWYAAWQGQWLIGWNKGTVVAGGTDTCSTAASAPFWKAFGREADRVLCMLLAYGVMDRVLPGRCPDPQGIGYIILQRDLRIAVSDGGLTARISQ